MNPTWRQIYINLFKKNPQNQTKKQPPIQKLVILYDGSNVIV